MTAVMLMLVPHWTTASSLFSLVASSSSTAFSLAASGRWAMCWMWAQDNPTLAATSTPMSSNMRIADVLPSVSQGVRMPMRLTR